MLNVVVLRVVVADIAIKCKTMLRRRSSLFSGHSTDGATVTDVNGAVTFTPGFSNDDVHVCACAVALRMYHDASVNHSITALALLVSSHKHTVVFIGEGCQ